MGGKASGRPGGNPDIKEYGFKQKYDRWDEPCTAKMTLRLPPSMYAELKELPHWQEKVREAIAAELEKNPPQEGDNIN
ncbi:MAG: hypothetical protein WBM62_15780 [Crocosphaera sp.]